MEEEGQFRKTPIEFFSSSLFKRTLTANDLVKGVGEEAVVVKTAGEGAGYVDLASFELAGLQGDSCGAEGEGHEGKEHEAHVGDGAGGMHG
jgi:hypothetical protein